jgi:hypothetical protein
MAGVESKRDSVLVVHADAVPASERTLECFESIARRDPEVSQGRSGVHIGQFAPHDRPECLRNRSRSFRIFIVEDVFGCGITERLNHLSNYTRLPGIR